MQATGSLVPERVEEDWVEQQGVVVWASVADSARAGEEEETAAGVKEAGRGLLG